SSKTSGEPSLTLGISAFFAIKRAIMDARRESTGEGRWLTMDLPATCERIQMACGLATESLNLQGPPPGAPRRPAADPPTPMAHAWSDPSTPRQPTEFVP